MVFDQNTKTQRGSQEYAIATSKFFYVCPPPNIYSPPYQTCRRTAPPYNNRPNAGKIFRRKSRLLDSRGPSIIMNDDDLTFCLARLLLPLLFFRLSLSHFICDSTNSRQPRTHCRLEHICRCFGIGFAVYWICEFAGFIVRVFCVCHLHACRTCHIGDGALYYIFVLGLRLWIGSVETPRPARSQKIITAQCQQNAPRARYPNSCAPPAAPLRGQTNGRSTYRPLPFVRCATMRLIILHVCVCEYVWRTDAEEKYIIEICGSLVFGFSFSFFAQQTQKEQRK